MNVEYGFVQYPEPKKALFRVETNEFKLPIGWIQREEEHVIIGETDDCFIYKLLPTKQGEWVGDVVIQREFILPIGVHKSRFVRWIPTQLPLFK